MMTDFTQSLKPASREDRQTQVCDFFLYMNKKIKRPDRLCLGWTSVDGDEARSYYYRLDGGILEIEVAPDGKGDYSRKVTDFITEPADLADMLGADYPRS